MDSPTTACAPGPDGRLEPGGAWKASTTQAPCAYSASIIHSLIVLRTGQMGAWNLARLQFNNPCTIQSFALASFADQRRAGRGREDPGSLEVGLVWGPNGVLRLLSRHF